MNEAYLRYARQIALPEIGKEGQQALMNAKVMIVGCGALGSMAAMQLAGAGVGKIGLADADTVDVSNLQRQFFFKTEEAGKSKAQLIAEEVLKLNPGVETEVFKEFITSAKARQIFKDYDFIIDATDNPESKKMIGLICRELMKPCCIGGVSGFSGQVMTLLPDTDRFEEYFGDAVGGNFLPCSLDGVFGPAAATCASIQAAEAIKFFVVPQKLLSGRLLVFNLLEPKFNIFFIEND